MQIPLCISIFRYFPGWDTTTRLILSTWFCRVLSCAEPSWVLCTDSGLRLKSRKLLGTITRTSSLGMLTRTSSTNSYLFDVITHWIVRLRSSTSTKGSWLVHYRHLTQMIVNRISELLSDIVSWPRPRLHSVIAQTKLMTWLSISVSLLKLILSVLTWKFRNLTSPVV